MSGAKLRKIMAVIAAGAMAVGMTGCNLMPVEEDIMPPPIQEPKKIALNTVTVEKASIQNTLYCVGTFISTEQAELKFDVSGAKLKNVYVATGDKVEQGQLLAELENNDIDASLKNQESDIAKAQLANVQTLTNLLNAIDTSKVRLAALKSELIELQNGDNDDEDVALEGLQRDLDDQNQAYEDLVKAEDEMKKEIADKTAESDDCNKKLKAISSSLHTANVTTAKVMQLQEQANKLKATVKANDESIKETNKQLEVYYKKYDAQKRKISDAQKAIERHMRDVEKNSEKIDEAKAKQIEAKKQEIKAQEKAVSSAQLAYETAEATISIDNQQRSDSEKELQEKADKTYMYSPINGVVSYVDNVAVGNYVDPSKPFIKMANRDKVILQYNTELEKAKQFAQDMKVTVNIRGTDYEGVVVQSPNDAPANADDVTKSSVRVSVPDMPDTITMGDAASITLVLEEADDVIVISKDLLRGSVGGYYVQVEENGIRVERSVDVGIISATEAEIKSGLEVGEKIIRG